MFFNHQQKSKDELLSTFGHLKNELFDFQHIEKYFWKKDNTNAFQILSNRTCHDLDFQELFMFLDRTNSKVGQQFLYNKLRANLHSPVENEAFEKLINQFTSNPDWRVSIQIALSKLNENKVYHIQSLFQDDHIKPPTWFYIIKLLSISTIIILMLGLMATKFFLILFGLFIINFGIHYSNKKNLYAYLITVPPLLRLYSIAKELFENEYLKAVNPNLSSSLAELKKVKGRMAYFRMEENLQGDFQAVAWGFMELIKILFLIEPLLLFSVLKVLDDKKKDIEAIFIFVGEIDTLISIASLRKGQPRFCLPKVIDGPEELFAQNMYHPLIPHCVSNSIRVNEKSVLLTGSNMSGKTSFIRAIGINVITGMALNTCFAEQFSLPRTKVFSAIRISDDLMNDKSYYFEEVLAIKAMIDKSAEGVSNLFLLDEIFKGTNTIERIAAGKAVLSHLAKAPNIVFVSTHDIELADLLKDEYELYHFSESVADKNIDFDYKLKPGKLTDRNAIKILETNHYPESIVREAFEIAQQLDNLKSK